MTETTNNNPSLSWTDCTNQVGQRFFAVLPFGKWSCEYLSESGVWRVMLEHCLYAPPVNYFKSLQKAQQHAEGSHQFVTQLSNALAVSDDEEEEERPYEEVMAQVLVNRRLAGFIRNQAYERLFFRRADYADLAWWDQEQVDTDVLQQELQHVCQQFSKDPKQTRLLPDLINLCSMLLCRQQFDIDREKVLAMSDHPFKEKAISRQPSHTSDGSHGRKH